MGSRAAEVRGALGLKETARLKLEMAGQITAPGSELQSCHLPSGMDSKWRSLEGALRRCDKGTGKVVARFGKQLADGSMQDVWPTEEG